MKTELIDAVKKRPAIWDQRHRNHHNRHHLADQWLAVAAELNCTDKRARQVWKTLRQEFGKQLKKAAPSEIPTWKHFNSLLFLSDQFEMCRSIDKSSSDDKCFEGSELNEDLDVSELHDLDVQTSSVINSPRDIEISEVRSMNVSLSENLYVHQSYDSNSSGVSRSENKNSPDRSWSGFGAEESRSDEDVGFFNSLLPHVKVLDPKMKMKFRMKVQELLYEMAYPTENSSAKH